MPEICTFHAGIRQLDDRLNALGALTRSSSPPAEDVLVAGRWAVVRTLAEIAAFDEKFVLAPAEVSGDKSLVAQADALGTAMKATMQHLIDHSYRWSAQAVHDDWPGFCRVLPVVQMFIRDHYAWEERVVPPLFAALKGVSAAPKRNWTRPIWAVQDAFKNK